MNKISFCFNWTCKHLGAPGSGAPVQIPHDAMLAEPRNELAGSGINGAWFEGHDYLYEKHFTPDAELADKKLVLEFEGVYRKAEVSVNGEKLAFRPYGYTNFYVDVTDTYYGEALAVVQAGEVGQLTVSISDGTYSAQAFVMIE